MIFEDALTVENAVNLENVFLMMKLMRSLKKQKNLTDLFLEVLFIMVQSIRH